MKILLFSSPPKQKKQTVVEQHGIDPVRLHILYKAPPSEVLEWEDTSIVGMQRWLAKVLKLAETAGNTTSTTSIPVLDKMSNEERDLYRETHTTIKQVTEAMSTTYSLNTAISDLIKLSNYINTSSVQASSPVYQHAVRSLVTMMAPVTPTLGEESWEAISRNDEKKSSVFAQSWPTFEEKALEKDTIDCVIQVKKKMQLKENYQDYCDGKWFFF